MIASPRPTLVRHARDRLVTLVLFTIVVCLGTFVPIGGRTNVGRFELNELHRSCR